MSLGAVGGSGVGCRDVVEDVGKGEAAPSAGAFACQYSFDGGDDGGEGGSIVSELDAVSICLC